MAEEFDVHQLEFYTQQEARRTFIARAVMLTLIFAMLSANMWMTKRNHEAILVNIDQARLEQVAFDEGQQEELVAIQKKMLRMEAQLTALQAQAVMNDAQVVASR